MSDEFSGNATDPSLPPIRSEMADDPTFAPLVEMFIEELQERLAAIESAWREREIEQLAALTHQLKGAGGGYGFQEVTNVSRSLESAVTDSEGEEQIERCLSELAAVCDAVLRGRA